MTRDGHKRVGRAPPSCCCMGIASTLVSALMFVLVLWAPSTMAEVLYRSIDDQGQVRYSDDPARGGEPVELPPISVVPGRPQPKQWPVSDSAPAASDPSTESLPGDATFTILEPVDDSTLPSGAAGRLTVVLGIRPALRQDYRVRLYLDGNRIAQQREPIFRLTDLVRGEHRLQAVLLDPQGRERQRTSAVTVHVKRARVPRP